VIITEIGGTVGDIESLPFLEAARQVRHDVGRDNVFFLHVSLVPYIGAVGRAEDQADPALGGGAAQHRHPARRARAARRPRVPDPIKRKIALMCDVDVEAVDLHAVDAPSIYDIPKVLHREGLDAYVVRRLGLPFRDVDWTEWDDLLRRVHDPEHEVDHRLVGKYIDLPDAYLSVTEALRAGGFAHDAKVNIRWVASDDCETPPGPRPRRSATSTACSCPAASASAASRASSAPSGMPASAGADARPVPGPAVHGHRVRAQRRRPRGRELDRVRPDTPDPVIATMAEQAVVRAATSAARCASAVPGQARARLGRRRGLRRHPVSTSGTGTATRSTTPTGPARGGGPGLAAPRPTAGSWSSSSCPRDVHPFYVATQAHPELKSRPTRAAPAVRRPDRMRRAPSPVHAERLCRMPPAAAGSSSTGSSRPRRRPSCEAATRHTPWEAVTISSAPGTPAPGPRTSSRTRH
jgi:CTP synthase